MINRIFRGLMCLAAMCLFASFASCGGFVLYHVPFPAHVMPVWLWNLTFTLMMLVGLGGFIYYTFALCDELFLKPNDTRRITRKREYRVTRKPA